MNRLLALLCAMALGLSATGTAQAATMSFGFFQEMAGITKQGDIKIDLYTAPNVANVRIGAFGGEVMIDGLGTGGIGYKASINRNVAAYGMLYLDSGTNVTNIQGGASYTGQSDALIYNLNGHILSSGGTTSTSINGAVFYAMSQRQVGGKVYIGGELLLELSPTNTTVITAGLRWMPKRNLIMDTGLMTSSGGTTSFVTPAYVRINLGL